jgi:uncharacterized MAPEG superfamily protein
MKCGYKCFRPAVQWTCEEDTINMADKNDNCENAKVPFSTRVYNGVSVKPHQYTFLNQRILTRLSVNPKAFRAVVIVPIAIFSSVPVVGFLARPNGFIYRLITTPLRAFTYAAGLPANATIPALSTLYVIGTYVFAAAGSASGIGAGQLEGRDNHHPRAGLHNLKGLPLRLHSAHSHMMEHLPGFALVAALAQFIAPNDRIVALLGLHVVLKIFV